MAAPRRAHRRLGGGHDREHLDLLPDPQHRTKEPHWGGTAFALSHLGLNTDVAIYIGFVGVVVNLVVAIAGTALLRALRTRDGSDQTAAADYFTDVADTPAAQPPVTAGT